MVDEADSFGLQTCIVSRNPAILLVGMDIGQTGYKRFSDGSLSVEHLADIVGERGHIIINPWWSIIGNDIWLSRLEGIELVAKNRPQTMFHFFCNTKAEVEFLHTRGHSAILINHNIFCNENKFVNLHTTKIFSAVYNAKMTSFKRHELAVKVKNLSLIYSRYGELETYYPRVREILGHATFLNGDPTSSSYKSFDSAQVCENLNRAKIGLCLSRNEGAMYASIEYLFCGLPIVSTHSTGGRDLFFDEQFCRTVEDSPDAVAQAVDDLIEQRIEPAFVRAETLKKIQASRETLFMFIEALQAREGGIPDGPKALNDMMSGPWACWTYRTIGDLRRGWKTIQ